MGKSHPNIFHIHLALVIVTLYVAVKVVAAAFYAFMPYTFWFTWHSVEPTMDTFPAGDPIIIVVDYEVPRPGPMFFSDRVMCRIENADKYVKVHTQSHGNEELVPVERRYYWFEIDYTSFVKKDCYIESEITQIMSNGTRKTQKLKSPNFFVGGKE